MTKRLPPHAPPPADVVDDLDPEPLVELVPTKAARYSGPVGLAFAIGVDLRPTQALLDLCADAIDDAANPTKPKRLKRKRRK